MAEAVSLSQRAAGETALHRVAVLAMAANTVGLLTGAMQTSSGDAEFSQLHLITGALAAVATAVLGVWLLRSIPRLGAALLIGAAAEAALGMISKDSTGIAVLHALIAPLLLSGVFAAMIATGRKWEAPPDLVEDQGWPSLSSLGKIVPVMVVLQIALGAAFRHKEMGVLSHLFFAMVLVLVILCLCIFVMQQFPEHKALRPAANMLMAVAFTQIFLGIAAFTVRSMNKIAPVVLVGVTAVHVLVGAFTLAAAIMMSMQIRRNVYRKKAEPE